ncbi:hypothetical protein [Marinitenerispora sediminis]|uniref:Uncharacterized protein n=1 Tax=Marinitenerispora sediminis TaxID=1931232 RepID=A0A368SZM7_9ACTN|nr:hypothetical protein [Marinitenerispora sediminis]RCV48071.1 hypothetical protein DEF28_24550 [Marinitenerispora sediminis]RCV51428.1 hypothetical protein DEF24_23205 [Marinitenerispora sediminis]RCV57700.1 hypothetical protein DEF23_10345 [Marinitenerispora sediminis]
MSGSKELTALYQLPDAHGIEVTVAGMVGYTVAGTALGLRPGRLSFSVPQGWQVPRAIEFHPDPRLRLRHRLTMNHAGAEARAAALDRLGYRREEHPRLYEDLAADLRAEQARTVRGWRAPRQRRASAPEAIDLALVAEDARRLMADPRLAEATRVFTAELAGPFAREPNTFRHADIPGEALARMLAPHRVATAIPENGIAVRRLADEPDAPARGGVLGALRRRSARRGDDQPARRSTGRRDTREGRGLG